MTEVIKQIAEDVGRRIKGEAKISDFYDTKHTQ